MNIFLKMLPLPLLFNVLTATLFDDDREDIALLNVLASLADEYEEEEQDDEDEEEDEEDEYIEEEELEEEENDVESGIEELEESEEESEATNDEPTIPKRRCLYTSSETDASTSRQSDPGTSTQPVAGSSTEPVAGSSTQPVAGSSTQPDAGSSTQADSGPSPQAGTSTQTDSASVRTSTVAIQCSSNGQRANRSTPDTSQERILYPSESQNQNLHSSGQFAQPVSLQNSTSRPSAMVQISQHNLPQARVILNLPNFGDVFPREE